MESDHGTAGPRYNAEAMRVHPSCDSLATVSVRVRVLSLLETTIHGRLPVADQSPFVLYNLGKDRESQVPVEELVVARSKVVCRGRFVGGLDYYVHLLRSKKGIRGVIGIKVILQMRSV